MRRVIAATACLIVIGVLAGCGTDEEPGAPVTSSVTTPTPAGGVQLPAGGAPKVEFPLDTARSEQAPCDTLSEGQLTEIFGSALTGEPRDVTGPTCSWSRNKPNPRVTVGFIKTTELGISNFYLGKDDGGFFLVMPPVVGYPAVAWGEDGERAEGTCRVAVGVTDRQVVDIRVKQSEDKIGKKDPCDDAHGIAEMVIGNIKGAQ
ncbi:DUF3558 domain-containing protein [Amycolatopsis lurida]